MFIPINMIGTNINQVTAEFWIKYYKLVILEPIFERCAICLIFISQWAVKAWIITNFTIPVKCKISKPRNRLFSERNEIERKRERKTRQIKNTLIMATWLTIWFNFLHTKIFEEKHIFASLIYYIDKNTMLFTVHRKNNLKLYFIILI